MFKILSAKGDGEMWLQNRRVEFWFVFRKLSEFFCSNLPAYVDRYTCNWL